MLRCLIATMLFAACTTHHHTMVIRVEKCTDPIGELDAGAPEHAAGRRPHTIAPHLPSGPVSPSGAPIAVDLDDAPRRPSGPVTPKGSPIAEDLDDDDPAVPKLKTWQP